MTHLYHTGIVISMNTAPDFINSQLRRERNTTMNTTMYKVTVVDDAGHRAATGVDIEVSTHDFLTISAAVYFWRSRRYRLSTRTVEILEWDAEDRSGTILLRFRGEDPDMGPETITGPLGSLS